MSNHFNHRTALTMFRPALTVARPALRRGLATAVPSGSANEFVAKRAEMRAHAVGESESCSDTTCFDTFRRGSTGAEKFRLVLRMAIWLWRCVGSDAYEIQRRPTSGARLGGCITSNSGELADLSSSRQQCCLSALLTSHPNPFSWNSTTPPDFTRLHLAYPSLFSLPPSNFTALPPAPTNLPCTPRLPHSPETASTSAFPASPSPLSGPTNRRWRTRSTSRMFNPNSLSTLHCPLSIHSVRFQRDAAPSTTHPSTPFCLLVTHLTVTATTRSARCTRT